MSDKMYRRLMQADIRPHDGFMRWFRERYLIFTMAIPSYWTDVAAMNLTGSGQSIWLGRKGLSRESD
jgi:hypothetical protein